MMASTKSLVSAARSLIFSGSSASLEITEATIPRAIHSAFRFMAFALFNETRTQKRHATLQPVVCNPKTHTGVRGTGVVDLADALLVNRIVTGHLPVDGLLARADVAPATGGPTDGSVDVGDALVILRASRGEALTVCNPMP
jgi:hypothetical protein